MILSDLKCVIAIQARMSSKRFPGKVLVKLQGRPIIEHMTNRLKDLNIPCFVLTSNHVSDDPLVKVLEELDQEVFRGSLKNVLDRFNSFLKIHPYSHVIRISADSPILHPEIISRIMEIEIENTCDVVTNLHPRTFPKGQSIEVIKSKTIEKISGLSLLESHREHLTSFIYDNPDHFQIINYANSQDLSEVNMCVDYREDLNRLEQMLDKLDISLAQGLPPWDDFSRLIKSRLC